MHMNVIYIFLDMDLYRNTPNNNALIKFRAKHLHIGAYISQPVYLKIISSFFRLTFHNESWYVSLEWYFIYLLFLASVHGFMHETTDVFTQ